MKSILALISIIILTLQISFGQANTNISEKVSKEIQVLQKADLNLSDVQISRITRVLNAEELLLEKNLKALEGNKSVLQQRLKELKVNKVNNIKGALTDKQLEKFDALKLADKF